MNFQTRPKRLTIFAGHYGSGKTTVAINYVLYLRAQNPKQKLTLCDLDIVNPYYRAADGANILRENHIPLIASGLANTNVEAIGIPPEAKSVFDDRDLCAVIDVGGDEPGARALGRFAAAIIAEDDYEMLMVVNQHRPLTRGVDSLLVYKNEMESASGLRFTGWVNNPNLGVETTPDTIAASAAFVREAERALSLELKMTTVFSAVAEGQEQAWDACGLKLFKMDFYEREVFTCRR